MRVLVIGAGLSGLAAAHELARAGVTVTLAERRAFAGGRTYSFRTPDGGEWDNGQHVFLGCCTAYRKFLDDVGAGDLVKLQKRTKVPFIDGRSGRTYWMRESLLPAPAHMLPSFLRYGLLTWKERKSVLKLGRELQRIDRSGLDGISMAAWLRERGQSANAIRNFWEVGVLALLNERADKVSAEQGIFVVQEGFFAGRQAGRVGYATVGLGRIAEKAVDAIRAAGGEVKFNAKIESLEGYDCYVPAVPARAMLELLTPEQRAIEFFAQVADMPTSPIINVHVQFDRPVWGHLFGCFVASPLQWVFNRTLLTGRDGATRLSISVSGAREYMDWKNEDLEKLFVDELCRVMPDARGAIVRRCLIVREPEATFVAVPGTKAKRLPCETPLPNVFLAGEWTESEWPSTMEAAVRNGVRAARAVMKAGGLPGAPAAAR